MNGIPPMLDRRPLTFSYSFLTAYDNVCAYQAWRTYVVRDIPYVETPERKKGNDAHDALALRVGAAHKPLPDTMRQWEPYAASLDGLGAKTEGKVAITSTGHPTGYFDKNVWFRGAIDVAVVRDTTGFILDWKVISDKGVRWTKRFELDVHAVLLHARYPQLKTIKAQYCFLNQGEMSETFDCSDTAATWARMNEIARQIEFDRMNESFEKRQGPLCSWCGVFDCENNTNSKAPT